MLAKARQVPTELLTITMTLVQTYMLMKLPNETPAWMSIGLTLVAAAIGVVACISIGFKLNPLVK